jgi:hypothetical protein
MNDAEAGEFGEVYVQFEHRYTYEVYQNKKLAWPLWP